jgi:hypothetical protein
MASFTPQHRDEFFRWFMVTKRRVVAETGRQSAHYCNMVAAREARVAVEQHQQEEDRERATVALVRVSQCHN